MFKSIVDIVKSIGICIFIIPALIVVILASAVVIPACLIVKAFMVYNTKVNNIYKKVQEGQ